MPECRILDEDPGDVNTWKRAGLVTTTPVFRIQNRPGEIHNRRCYDRSHVVLVAFLVALGLSLAATAFSVVRALSLYRQAKRTGRALAEPLSSFEEKAAEVDRHLDAFDASSKELERALAQLRRSRARLQILLDALERSQGRLRWLRAFIPAR